MLVSGCYNLGLMYYKGQQVEQDYAKAANAFIIACDDGHGAACYNLSLYVSKWSRCKT